MNFNLTVDQSRFNRSMQTLSAVAGQDARTLVKDESRRLSVECSNVVGPRTKAQGVAQIVKDVGNFFYTKPDENIKTGTSTGFHWMYAGPDFLVGAKDVDYMPEFGSNLVAQLRAEQQNPRGKNRWKMVGMRGRQHAWIVDKPVVASKDIKRIIVELSKRVGKLKASFAAHADRLGETRGIPAWVKVHLPALTTGISDTTGLSDQNNPSVIFGSEQTGASKQEAAIQIACRNRSAKMVARARKIVKYYKDKLENGEAPTESAAMEPLTE